MLSSVPKEPRAGHGGVPEEPRAGHGGVPKGPRAVPGSFLNGQEQCKLMDYSKSVYIHILYVPVLDKTWVYFIFRL